MKPFRTGAILRNGMFRLESTNRSFSRFYSIKPKKSPSVRDLFKTLVFKSLFLTLVFGSAVVEATKNRKELEGLNQAYEAKFRILQDITQRIKAKESVDVVLELKIANSITRNKYHSVTDVELDDQFETFLKMTEKEDLAKYTDSNPGSSNPGSSNPGSSKPDVSQERKSSLFM